MKRFTSFPILRLNTVPAVVSFLSMTILAILLPSCTYNWPQFRGPDADMVPEARHLPQTWGEEENIRWTTAVEGESWTSPIIWGNRVFYAAAVPVKVAPEPERPPSPPPTARRDNTAAEGQQPDGPTPGPPGQPPPGTPGQPPPQPEEQQAYLDDIYRWEVTCLDLETGEELWKQVAVEGSPREKKHRATNYASETPVTDGKRLFVYFGNTGLYCYSLEGELLWDKDLGAFETLRDWGTGSSPVLHRGLLCVQVDNEAQSFVAALDASTGEEVWRAEREEGTNYSTPVIWKNRSRTELVVGGKTARSYDPETGELLWQLEVPGYYNMPSPVADRDHLYLGNTAFRDTPGSMICVRAGASGDITPPEGDTTSSGVVWMHRDISTGNPSPLLYEGYLYLLSSRGGDLTCLDAATGAIVYEERATRVGACWASPWAYEGRIYFIDENGVTSVVEAGPEFELLHQNTLDDKFWASPAFASDAMILKGVEKMYCVGE